MTQTDSTTWPYSPHTEAKHYILKYYLGAWFPILATTQQRLIYVDGFAGPGEYEGGEDGSPIIALKVAKDHVLKDKLQRGGMQLVFFFIEKDEERFQNLQRRLSELELPDNFSIVTKCDSFEAAFGNVLTEIEQQSKQLAPSFVFIDPFGSTGFPMTLIQKLATQLRTEVLINFSYQSLNRWSLQDPTKHPRLDELFGDGRWRPALTMGDSKKKEDFLVQEYCKALQERDWRGTHFRMVNKYNQTQYYLIFGTQYYLGMLVMKRAMWSADPEGTFAFSDMSNPNQPKLFLATLDEEYSKELAEIIFANRRGTAVPKETILQNEVAWHPTAIDKHLTHALRIMEYETTPPKIVNVQKIDGSRRRAKTYPANCRIQFAG